MREMLRRLNAQNIDQMPRFKQKNFRLVGCGFYNMSKAKFLLKSLLTHLILSIYVFIAPVNVMAQNDTSTAPMLSHFPPNSRAVWGKLIKLISDKNGFFELNDIADALGINFWPNKTTVGKSTMYYLSGDNLSPFNAAIMITITDSDQLKYRQSSVNIIWTYSASEADCEPIIEFESKLKLLGWKATGLIFQPRLNEQFSKDHALIDVVPDGTYPTACLKSMSALSSPSR